MKKLFVGLACLFMIGAAPACIMVGNNNFVPAMAEEEAPACTVIIPEFEHGKIDADKLSGNVGDQVELFIDVDSLYALDSLSVNGNAISKNDDGKFVFALVEGENKIDAKFILSETEMSKVASILNGLELDWRNVFTLKNILMILSYVMSSGFGIALICIYKKYRNTKTIDRKDVIDAVNQALPEQSKEIINEIVKENIVPMISELVVGLNATEEAFTKFIQAYLYSLDGTMESKEKIVSILGDLKLSDTTTVNSLKEWISGELAKIKEENEKKVRLLKELGEMNGKAKSESVILNDSDENKDIRF